MYTERTFGGKDECASGVLYAPESPVHDVHMAQSRAKKAAVRSSEAKFRPTFIKQWRIKRDLTQEELAERVAEYLARHGDESGYTYASIGRLENGKIGYTQLVLEAVANALGTDPASLLTRSPSDQSSMWAVWDKALPEEREIIEQQAEIVVRNRRRSA